MILDSIPEVLSIIMNYFIRWQVDRYRVKYRLSVPFWLTIVCVITSDTYTYVYTLCAVAGYTIICIIWIRQYQPKQQYFTSFYSVPLFPALFWLRSSTSFIYKLICIPSLQINMLYLITDEDEDQGGGAGGAGGDAQGSMQILDLTESDLVNLRRTLYLTIMSSVSFEECAHKITRLKIPDGYELELCNMLGKRGELYSYKSESVICIYSIFVLERVIDR